MIQQHVTDLQNLEKDRKASLAPYTYTIYISFAVFLGISVILNLILGWVTWKSFTRLLFVSENLDFLVQIVTSFRKHLKKVYEMEMFYGDRTMELLIKHTRELSEDLKRYEDVYLSMLNRNNLYKVSYV